MKNRIVGNAMWIIIMQCAKALITMVVSMLTTRLLGPSNYGLINYAASIVSFVAPIMYLGYNNTLVRELVTNPGKEGEILGTAIGSSLISGVVCVGFVAAFSVLANAGERDTILVCTIYSTVLIFQSIDLILYWFQAKLLNKYSSVAALCAYIIVAAYKVCILLLGKNVYWFAISSAVEYMLVSGALLLVYKRLGGQKFHFSFSRMKSMLRESRFYILAALLGSVSAYVDRIMLKLLINDTANGYYSAAVTCAAMATFVFTAIIDSFRPEIVEYKNQSEEKYRNMVKLLYSIIIYLSLGQCVTFFVLAKPIVQVICGSDYAASVPLLRIVVWYTLFSNLTAARNVWILAEHKERYLWLLSLTGATVTVVANLLFIPLWGSTGAAIVSLISNFITSVVMTFVIRPLRDNFLLIVQATNPRVFIRATVNLTNRFLKKGN